MAQKQASESHQDEPQNQASSSAPDSSVEGHVDRVMRALRRDFIVVGKGRVRSWTAWLLIGMVAGLVGGVIGVANRSGEFTTSFAQSLLPQGFVDRAVAQLCTISGWANDPDTTEPITVKVYRGAPLGEGGVLVGAVQANLARGDGLPGFSFTFPREFDSEFYAYAVGVDASGIPDTQRLLSLYSQEVPSSQLTCDEGPDSDEGSNDVFFSKVFNVDFKVRFGGVESIVRMNELGIRGVNPDGHISAQAVGNQVNTYFTCSDGSTTLTCLSENSSIDDFGDLSGLYTDVTGQVFQTVMEGKIPGDAYEDKYASLVSIWRDPTTGLVHGWYHAETFVNRDGCPAPVTYAAVGHAVSQDDGKSFAKQGMVLTSDAMKDPSACVGQGTAHPKVIQAGDYIYMFYDSWPPGFSEGGVAVARAHVSNPGEWFKYYNGGFSEPGVAGQDTPVIVRGGANGSLWHPSVFWSAYLNSYLMIHSDFSQEGAFFLRTSPDLLSWSPVRLLVEAPARWGYRYATFLTSDSQAKEGWLYFGRHPKDGRIGPDTLLARRSVHFDLDMTPPTDPQMLIAKAKGQGIELSWRVASDNVGVAGYRVYRDGSLVATASDTIYQDTTVSGGTTYAYFVTAFDAAENESTASDSLTVKAKGRR